MNVDTPQEKARREALYLAVGRTIYTCQLLESQLRLVLAILNDKLALQVDFHSLAAPDEKRTLGQLIHALGQFGEVSADTHPTLASALEARNRIVHQFIIRNIDAISSDAVLREALAALKEDERKLSACAILMHGVYQRLCRTMGIDDSRIVVAQDRVHESVHE